MQHGHQTKHTADQALEVSAEQVRIVYKHIKPGIIATVINALLLAYIQWGVVETAVLFGWFAFLLTVNLIRYGIVMAYEHAQPGIHDSARWGRYFVYGASFAGMAWGLSAVLLLPEGHPTQQFITMLVLAGTVAGATATQASLLRAFSFFSLLSLVPLFIKLLILGGLIHNILAVFTSIFLFFMLSTAKRNCEILRTSLILNFDNQRLLGNLEEEKRQTDALNENLKREISQRLHAELQLRKRESSLEEAQRIARLGSWEWDARDNMVMLSAEMRHLYGIDPSTDYMDYTEFLSIIVDSDREAVERCRTNALHQNIPYKIEYRVPKAGNHDLILEEQGIVRIGDTGKTIGLSAIAMDITQRKEIERIKSDFVSIVSHELRTPLTSISGALSLIRGGATEELPEKAQELVNVAQRNAVRLTNLVNDILDIDKLEFGGLPLQLQAVDLVAVVDDAIVENQGYAEKLGVSLQLVDRPRPVQLTGDRDRLIQVMTNLLSNAAKYSPKGETVEVRIRPEAGHVRIEVSDHGPGIAESFRDKVFQKFCQGDSSDSRYQYGTGLGLNIARIIVQKHGGDIGFDTEAGKGTTFWFTLPLSHD